MSRTKSFEEAAVLDRAMELFWQRGYEGTSMADLESHLGLGRQSLYNAFGDKHALFLKALRRYQEERAAELLEILTAGAGLPAIRAYFKASVDGLTAASPPRACLVANTIVERGGHDPAALLSCNVARTNLEAALRGAVTQAVRRREVAQGSDVEATVTLLVTQSYGLAVLAKTGASAADMLAAVEALLRGLG